MIGRRLAHFEVVQKLGEGGMGVVYEAIDHHLDRRVALKILPPEKMADRARKERFIQEAKAASALNHPNIVTIYDISAADGVDYIAMELVSGRTLEDALVRRKPRTPEALRWATQIADALAVAHAAGIVHRDLKPANVMITDSGLVKILDFGLAKLTEQQPPEEDEATRTARVHTEEGTVMGSAPYMSPEQAEGRKVDARSDIFSFGAVLYEMLSGKRAFGGDTRMSTMAAIIHKEPESLAALAPGLPREIERIVSRCLRKDVTRRSQNMADIKLELEELKDESESGSIAANAAARSRAPARKLLWIGIGAAALAIAAAAFLVGARKEAAPPLVETPLTSYTGVQGYPSLSPDGGQFAFSWDGDQENGPVQLYVSLIGRGAPLRLTNSPDQAAQFPAWSPDGQTIAFLHGRSLALVPPLGGPELTLDETIGNMAGRAAAPSWSPDAKWLYFSSALPGARSLAIFVTASNGGGRTQITDPPPVTGFGDTYPSVSPDGSKLAFVRVAADYDADLFVLDLPPAKGRAPRRLTNRHELARSPVWTPDGKEILYAAGDNTIVSGVYRLPVSGGEPVRVSGVGSYAWDLALSRNGKRLVYSRQFRDYNIWRMPLPGSGKAAGDQVKFIASTRYEVSPAYSPDGKRIAFSSNRNGTRQIWVADSDGSNPRALTNFQQGMSGSPRWSPDGSTIVFDARPAGASDVYSVRADGGEPKRLTDHPAEDHVPCFSMDGRWIYFSSTRSGEREIYRIPAVGGPAVQITRGGAFSAVAADAKWLYYTKSGTLWKAPADGGTGSLIVTGLRGSPLNFGVAPSGIYYSEVVTRGRELLKLYRFGDGVVQELGSFDKLPFLQFGVSPDEKWLLYTRIDSTINDLMLVDNFH